MFLLCARSSSRSLVPAGAAMTVTATFWMGEHTVSNVSSRVVSPQISNAISRKWLSQLQSSSRQRATAFSTDTKSGASGAAQGPKPASFVEWYEGHLQTRPVITKMITGAFLWGLGDAVAQVIPPLFYPPEGDAEPVKYDLPRTGRAVLFGFALHAPTSHVHYNFLEWMTVRSGLTGLKIPVFKAFMEQFVYWSWLSNSMYHGAMGAMQGLNGEQIYKRIEDVLWETQKAQWVFWIPVQLLNFRYVPVRHQLNVVLVTSVVWTALLSAWYPPQEDKQEEKEE